jgi:glucose-1-phosphate cytidylyltransferase
MKAVILAGGLGTRISEETSSRPKPMVEVGGKPILWHILKIYSHHGIHDFIVCCGYKGYVIKEYFANYFLHTSDVTFDMSDNSMQVHARKAEPWRVTLVDTGDSTLTGGRLARVRDFLEDEPFCFTYGDGVADVNVGELIAFHHACDQSDFEVANDLLVILEKMLKRPSVGSDTNRRKSIESLIAAHERLWLLRHPEAREG